METPTIRYAWNGDIALAYQVLEAGTADLVYLQGFVSNVEANWEHPALARFLRELSSFSRLIVTDRRGLGCSERFTPADTPPIEALVDDVAAVLAAVGCDRPILFSTGDCGFIACLFAATHPEQLSGLVLFGASPTWRRSEEIPWGWTEEELEDANRRISANLGDGSWMHRAAPSAISDTHELEWAGRYERLSLAPGACYSEGVRFAQTDIRAVLPSIQIPTLVMHRSHDPQEEPESGRYLASHIRGGRFGELPGADHFPWAGDQESVLRELRRFVSIVREEEAELDRVLATILFTDIVGSTEKAAELGDRRWRDLLEQHHSTVRALLARYRGRELSTAGDGFFAIFDGPARAVRCAESISEAVRPLGVEIRAGLHTGEVEAAGEEVRGIAVHIGARIAALAGASEILVSQTVKDLVAGSGLGFEDRGSHRLKGVPGDWRVYAVAPG